MTPNLEVLIPLKQRTTINKTILSLLEIEKVNLITILSGDKKNIIHPEITNNAKVRIINLSPYPFCKTFYLNHGIKNSIGKILLISDADIIWNNNTVETIFNHINQNFSQPLIIYIDKVKETDINSKSLKRPRFKPIISRKKDKIHLNIIQELTTSKRPGCGLICATKNNLLSLGGYNEQLQEWGWEDQDLLIRASILEYEVKSMGTVLHQSHGDDVRNLSQKSPIFTRNRNIGISNQMILRGKVYGSLRKNTSPFNKNIIITMDLSY